ncbi:hypothetical protein OV203_25510 [Nannocystis sp. ILAH1]|uniref:hypothetical protein n=1 Tax=Nannocystis sp. ILAH1 TaxID=2996789 RepID=UPI002271AB85|nr:hypothetical protein [Nannocystis sp. ILAH1]MCY0990525.1 hypothetical protein [Nannocystis sp. ILAH1]
MSPPIRRAVATFEVVIAAEPAASPRVAQCCNLPHGVFPKHDVGELLKRFLDTWPIVQVRVTPASATVLERADDASDGSSSAREFAAIVHAANHALDDFCRECTEARRRRLGESTAPRHSHDCPERTEVELFVRVRPVVRVATRGRIGHDHDFSKECTEAAVRGASGSVVPSRAAAC